MTDQRLASYQGNMQGLMFFDEAQNAVDQCIAAKVGKIAQRAFAAKVRVAIGITSGTTQRAFAGDFDGKQGRMTGKNVFPSAQHFKDGDSGSN